MGKFRCFGKGKQPSACICSTRNWWKSRFADDSIPVQNPLGKAASVFKAINNRSTNGLGKSQPQYLLLSSTSSTLIVRFTSMTVPYAPELSLRDGQPTECSILNERASERTIKIENINKCQIIFCSNNHFWKINSFQLALQSTSDPGVMVAGSHSPLKLRDKCFVQIINQRYLSQQRATEKATLSAPPVKANSRKWIALKQFV